MLKKLIKLYILLKGGSVMSLLKLIPEQLDEEANKLYSKIEKSEESIVKIEKKIHEDKDKILINEKVSENLKNLGF